MWQKTKPELIFLWTLVINFIIWKFIISPSVVLQSRKFTSIWPQFHTELFYNQVDSQSKLVFFRVAGTEGWSNPISIFFVEMNKPKRWTVSFWNIGFSTDLNLFLRFLHLMTRQSLCIFHSKDIISTTVA